MHQIEYLKLLFRGSACTTEKSEYLRLLDRGYAWATEQIEYLIILAGCFTTEGFLFAWTSASYTSSKHNLRVTKPLVIDPEVTWRQKKEHERCKAHNSEHSRGKASD